MKSLITFVMFGSLASAASVLSVLPTPSQVAPGVVFDVRVDILDASDLYAFQFDLTFDPTIVSVASVYNGLFLSANGDGTFFPGFVDNDSGIVSFVADSKIGPVSGNSGNGTLASFRFTAVGPGSADIVVGGVVLLDSTLVETSFAAAAGSVVVSGGAQVPEPRTVGLVFSAVVGLWLRLRRFSWCRSFANQGVVTCPGCAPGISD